jgi:hypothetical protein
MRTLILASVALLAIGAGVALADGGDGEGGDTATTRFTSIPGEQPSPSQPGTPQATVNQAGTTVILSREPMQPETHVFVTKSDRGVWLFPP